MSETAQVVKQAPESVTAIGQAVASALATNLAPVLEALKQDSVQRHKVGGVAQSAIDLATIATQDVKYLTQRVNALVGDGSGENGQIASMQRAMRTIENDVREQKADMKNALTSLAKLEGASAKSNTFMDGWKGVSIAAGAIVSLITMVGGIVASVLWLYKH